VQNLILRPYFDFEAICRIKKGPARVLPGKGGRGEICKHGWKTAQVLDLAVPMENISIYSP
jgi:hypothetical protein